MGIAFSRMREFQRDLEPRVFSDGRPHPFELVVGAASGVFFCQAGAVLWDEAACVIRIDDPRGFRLVVRADVANFPCNTHGCVRDDAVAGGSDGCLRYFG